MIKVTILPENKSFELRTGATILESAFENGVEIPSQCQMGTCSTCMVYVEKGGEFLCENFGDEYYYNPKSSKSMLSCISELKDKCHEGEIIIKISSKIE
jgi:ferredoxin